MKPFVNHIITIIFITASLTLSAQDHAQLWEKANALFTAGEYQKAIDAYEQILLSGQESAKLYFNLGNAYYKAGNMNNAILNYERAKILAPGDEDIDFNLKVANQFVVTRIEELPKPFFTRTWNKLTNLFSTDKWASASLISFLLFLTLLGLYLFGKNINVRRIAFWMGVLMLVISFFSYGFAAKQKKLITNRNMAIVFCPRVTVKSSPSQSGTDLFLIYEGLKVEITQKIEKWNEIKLADGNKGWLPDSCIVKI